MRAHTAFADVFFLLAARHHIYWWRWRQLSVQEERSYPRQSVLLYSTGSFNSEHLPLTLTRLLQVSVDKSDVRIEGSSDSEFAALMDPSSEDGNFGAVCLLLLLSYWAWYRHKSPRQHNARHGDKIARRPK
jgi:hypothetical protein